MSRATFIVGDTRDVVATLTDGSVDLVMTSPPFLALRSYLPADHPDKDREIGSEPTPADFLDTLLELTAEWRRVLAPHGSIAVELGDTYSGSGGAGGDYADDGLRAGQQKFDGSARRQPCGWPLAKSLALIPELYRIALAYGINPLTGAESPAGRWRVRNVVRWVRPNPPVGALGDKYRPATSDLVIACTSSKRWFDLDAVRTEVKDPAGRGAPNGDGRNGDPGRYDSNPAGAPPLDWWNIPPGGYPGSHYAVYPPELCVIPIKSMCPAEVCRACGEPRRRIVGEAEYVDRRGNGPGHAWTTGENGVRSMKKPVDGGGMTKLAPTLGWSDCGCDAGWRPGVVLDPFGGSGTTGMVATGHGRDAILVDLDERNADLARERIGMFLDVVHHEEATS